MDEKPSKEAPKLDVNVDLLQRIEKLEKEKKELAESVKMLKVDKNGLFCEKIMSCILEEYSKQQMEKGESILETLEDLGAV